MLLNQHLNYVKVNWFTETHNPNPQNHYCHYHHHHHITFEIKSDSVFIYCTTNV